MNNKITQNTMERQQIIKQQFRLFLKEKGFGSVYKFVKAVVKTVLEETGISYTKQDYDVAFDNLFKHYNSRISGILAGRISVGRETLRLWRRVIKKCSFTDLDRIFNPEDYEPCYMGNFQENLKNSQFQSEFNFIEVINSRKIEWNKNLRITYQDYDLQHEPKFGHYVMHPSHIKSSNIVIIHPCKSAKCDLN